MLVASLAFSFYLTHFAAYERVYGVLGAAVAPSLGLAAEHRPARRLRGDRLLERADGHDSGAGARGARAALRLALARAVGGAACPRRRAGPHRDEGPVTTVARRETTSGAALR